MIEKCEYGYDYIINENPEHESYFIHSQWMLIKITNMHLVNHCYHIRINVTLDVYT